MTKIDTTGSAGRFTYSGLNTVVNTYSRQNGLITGIPLILLDYTNKTNTTRYSQPKMHDTVERTNAERMEDVESDNYVTHNKTDTNIL